MKRVLRTVERHRPALAILGLLAASGVFPAGPLDLRIRLAGLFSPLAMVRPGPGRPGGAGDGDGDAAARLREERDHLLGRTQALEREVRELRQFRGLDLAAPSPGRILVAAEVVCRDRNWPFRRSVFIDRGTGDGIRRGLPAVAGRSLVGFVDEAAPSWSRIVLLDDPGVRVGIEVVPGEAGAPPRSAEGALVGGGRGALSLRLLPAGSVRVGDLVFTTTSSLTRPVPAGLLVGRVTEARDIPRDGLAEAEVSPAGDLEGLRHVFVVGTSLPGEPAAAGGRR